MSKLGPRYESITFGEKVSIAAIFGGTFVLGTALHTCEEPTFAKQYTTLG